MDFTIPRTPSLEAVHKALTDYLRHGKVTPTTLPALATVNQSVAGALAGVNDLHAVPGAQRRALRLDIYLASEVAARLVKNKQLPDKLNAAPVTK